MHLLYKLGFQADREKMTTESEHSIKRIETNNDKGLVIVNSRI